MQTKTVVIKEFILAGMCFLWASSGSAQNLALKAAGEDNAAVAQGYYATIDPNDERLTQTNWEEINGFKDGRNTVVKAAGYLNIGDLGGFFRVIEMVEDQRPGYEGNIAFTTANYLTQEDALFDAQAGNFKKSASIVNMEYSPGPEEDKIVKFYVYDGMTGNRLLKTIFSDGGDELYLPAACYSCHGGDDDTDVAEADGYNEGSGETNATFLLFDITTMAFSDPVTRASLEPAFKAFNEAVLHADPTRATKQRIKDLYSGSGLPSDTQNTDFVPADWAADHLDAELFTEVVVPYCMNCHTTSDKKLLNLSFWKNNPEKIRDSVYDEMFMPNSVPGYRSFMDNDDAQQIFIEALNRFEE